VSFKTAFGGGIDSGVGLKDLKAEVFTKAMAEKSRGKSQTKLERITLGI